MGEPGPETTGEAGEEGRVADAGLAGALSDAAAEGDNVGEGSQQPDNEEEHAARNEEICAQCGTDVAKYRCPRCNIRTCSAGCVKAHKDDTGCTGKRDRTAYVSLREFDDRQLGSDYGFLEDAMRQKDNAKRGRPPAPRDELPHHLSALVHQARRRSVELLLQAPGMVKRKSNTTRVDWKRHRLLWRIEWRFPKAAMTCSDDRVDEKRGLEEVLLEHVKLREGQAAKHHKLREYSSAAGLGGDRGLQVFLKQERCPANAPKYYRIDCSSCLENQMAGKTVVEFPVFIVALPEEAASYPVDAAGRNLDE